MAVRPYLSSITRSGRIELTNTGAYTQLTATPVINLTSPIKIFVQNGYAGIVKVSLSNNDSSQIRFIVGGDTAYFDECRSPSQLWIKPTVSSAGYFCYARWGEE